MREFAIDAPSDLRAWELVVDGDVYVLFQWSVVRGSEPLNLTSAEQEVLQAILHGESNATIAERRGTRQRTVANQIASLFRKLGVHSRAELVARLVSRNGA